MCVQRFEGYVGVHHEGDEASTLRQRVPFSLVMIRHGVVVHGLEPRAVNELPVNRQVAIGVFLPFRLCKPFYDSPELA